MPCNDLVLDVVRGFLGRVATLFRFGQFFYCLIPELIFATFRLIILFPNFISTLKYLYSVGILSFSVFNEVRDEFLTDFRLISSTRTVERRRRCSQLILPRLVDVDLADPSEVRTSLQSLFITSVLNLKFSGLQIDSKIADSPYFGEDWSWVDALLRWSWMKWNAPS
jgi:hypothetical protein